MSEVLSAEQQGAILSTLQKRFEKNLFRHKGVTWSEVLARLEESPTKLWSLVEMERTGGEPDVIGVDESTDEILFCDCSAASPTGRRSLCYDRQGWEERKEFKPETSAMEMANAMGIEMLDEEQYRHLQTLGDFDLKTSSWIRTPSNVGDLGGSIFGDKRFDRVFVYHNTAQSYYGSRGFRGLLRV